MHGITVNLSPEDINQEVARAVTQSVLGESIEQGVRDYVKSLSSGYNSPLEKLIQTKAAEIITRMLEEQYRDQILVEVAKQLTPEVTSQLVKGAIEKMMRAVHF